MAATGNATLMSMPLEIRHNIFGYLSERKDGPKKLLQTWFEKREATKLAANAPPQPDGEDDDDEGGEETENGDEDEEMGDDDGDGDGDGDEDGDGDGDEDGDEEDEDGDDDGDGTTVAATATATTTTILPPVSRKWRHIPGIMSLSHCPPPLPLLLVCQQIHVEAAAYYYKVATLRINATAAFPHITFFEEAMDTLSDAAFSPTEPIRKVEITFVWDTQWLRASNAVESIFVAMLHQRAIKAAEVLGKAPSLDKLLVKWYDSVRDDESLGLQTDVMQHFWGFLDRAEVKVEEHYLESGTEPNEDSVQGRCRLAFEHMLTDGQQFY
ncbi:hypothetical protein K432DRAFT_387058 [Lepidopterella palustris CBS 459.81]|uniref:Uncharacterized protein n=1 Tax=Lepidopterella palustris CBS 459.81 TaxID=1314670 RepID=A0A8E2J996_9PEZI|nr:hypothetical protein K432DRAFT_387058 [Lepidopterella palustris CBS 459.81]